MQREGVSSVYVCFKGWVRQVKIDGRSSVIVNIMFVFSGGGKENKKIRNEVLEQLIATYYIYE